MATIGALTFDTADRPPQRVAVRVVPYLHPAGGVAHVSQASQADAYAMAFTGVLATVPDVEALVGTAIAVSAFGVTANAVVEGATVVSAIPVTNDGGVTIKRQVRASFQLRAVP
jgi:hypothetical protein